MTTFPVLMHVALDATDVRALADFYRELLGLQYRPGDEVQPEAAPEQDDWLVLVDDGGQRVLAVNQVEELARSTWPADDIPKQILPCAHGRGPGAPPPARRGDRGECPVRSHGRGGRTALRTRRSGRAPLLHSCGIGVVDRRCQSSSCSSAVVHRTRIASRVCSSGRCSWCTARVLPVAAGSTRSCTVDGAAHPAG